MLSGRTEKYTVEIQLLCVGEIQKYSAVRMFMASAGREIFWEIPISINYVLCRLLLRDASDSRINPLSLLRLIFPHRGKNKALEREEIIIGHFLPRLEVSQIDFPLNNIQFFPSAPPFPPNLTLIPRASGVCISPESPFVFLQNHHFHFFSGTFCVRPTATHASVCHLKSVMLVAPLCCRSTLVP